MKKLICLAGVILISGIQGEIEYGKPTWAFNIPVNTVVTRTKWADTPNKHGGALFSYRPSPMRNGFSDTRGTCRITFPEAIELFYPYNADIKIDAVPQKNSWLIVSGMGEGDRFGKHDNRYGYDFVVFFKSGSKPFSADDVIMNCDSSESYSYGIDTDRDSRVLPGCTTGKNGLRRMYFLNCLYSFNLPKDTTTYSSKRLTLYNNDSSWDSVPTYVLTLGAPVRNFSIGSRGGGGETFYFTTEDNQTFRIHSIRRNVNGLYVNWEYDTYFQDNTVSFFPELL